MYKHVVLHSPEPSPEQSHFGPNESKLLACYCDHVIQDCQNLKAQIGEQGKLRSYRQMSKRLPALAMPHGHLITGM